MKRHIKNLSEEDLLNYFESFGEKRFRIKQLYHSLYQSKCTDFSEILNFSPQLREKLTTDFEVFSLSFVDKSTSSDGTQKILFSTQDGKYIESVFLPNAEIEGNNS